MAAIRRRDPGESAGSSAHAGGRGGHALARRLARRSRAAAPPRARSRRPRRGTHRRRVRREDPGDRGRGLHLGPRADHRAGSARSRAPGYRGDAARVVAAPRPRRAPRRPQDGAGARLAAHAHERRLDARVSADPRVRRSPDPGRARAWRDADRRVPHGDPEPGDLLRARRRPGRHRAGSLRRHLRARRPRRAAAVDRDRARQGDRRRRPPDGRASRSRPGGGSSDRPRRGSPCAGALGPTTSSFRAALAIPSSSSSAR